MLIPVAIMEQICI